ncbi:MAG: DUF1190 domain-containing protein [Chthoniobacterales bacterium]
MSRVRSPRACRIKSRDGSIFAANGVAAATARTTQPKPTATRLTNRSGFGSSASARASRSASNGNAGNV